MASFKNIAPDEVRQAARTLFHGLKNDPLMLWLFGNKEKYQQVGQAFMEGAVSYCVRYGVAYRTENFEAVAIRRKPGDTRFTFWRLFRSGLIKAKSILGKQGFDRLTLLDKKQQEQSAKNMYDQRFWYCWMLATLPEERRQGYASVLIKETFAIATRAGLPCYLETASEEALKVHLHYGYQEKSRFRLPESDFDIVCMVRLPD